MAHQGVVDAPQVSQSVSGVSSLVQKTMAGDILHEERYTFRVSRAKWFFTRPLDGFLVAYADQTYLAGVRRLVGQGLQAEMGGRTGIGAVPVKVPRVSDPAWEGARIYLDVPAA